MKAVFLDTVGLIAVWDRSDQWHTAATAAYTKLKRLNRVFVTTELVLFECGNAAARRPYRSRVTSLRDVMIEEGLIVQPSDIEVDQAWAAFRQGGPEGAGIVDHISFTVMRREGIREVFTNDRHFEAAGFITLF